MVLLIAFGSYLHTLKRITYKKMVPSPGFEPESSDRKSEMIDRTTPQGHKVDSHTNGRPMDPPGFEPGIYASLKQINVM